MSSRQCLPQYSCPSFLLMVHTLVFLCLWQVFPWMFLSEDLVAGTQLCENWGTGKTGEEVSEVSDQSVTSSWTTVSNILAAHTLKLQVHRCKNKRGLGCTCKTAQYPSVQACVYSDIKWPHMQPLHQFCHRLGPTAWHQFPHQNPKDAFLAD